MKKSHRLVQAATWLEGEKQTTPEDLARLSDSLWREPMNDYKLPRV